MKSLFGGERRNDYVISLEVLMLLFVCRHFGKQWCISIFPSKMCIMMKVDTVG